MGCPSSQAVVCQSDAPTHRKTRRPFQPSGMRTRRAYHPTSPSSATPERGAPQGKGTVIVDSKAAGSRSNQRSGLPRVLRVEAEAPRPVQVHPLGPLEPGARVLRQGDAGFVGQPGHRGEEDEDDGSEGATHQDHLQFGGHNTQLTPWAQAALSTAGGSNSAHTGR